MLRCVNKTPCNRGSFCPHSDLVGEIASALQPGYENSGIGGDQLLESPLITMALMIGTGSKVCLAQISQVSFDRINVADRASE